MSTPISTRATVSNMAEPLRFTAVYEPVEDGWIQGRLEEWPAVVTCAPTLEEARELLRDAFREMVLACAGAGAPALGGTDATREPMELLIG